MAFGKCGSVGVACTPSLKPLSLSRLLFARPRGDALVQRLSDRRDPIVRVSVKWPGTLASEKAIRRAPPQGRYSIHTRSHARGMTKLPPLSKGGLSRFPVMGIPPSWVALLTTTKPAPRGCSPNLYSLGCRGRQIVTVGASRRWPGSSKALMPQRQSWGLSVYSIRLPVRYCRGFRGSDRDVPDLP